MPNGTAKMASTGQSTVSPQTAAGSSTATLTYHAPTYRSGDSTFGELIGTLCSIGEYLRWNAALLMVDGAFGGIWGIGGTICSAFKSFFQYIYDRIYQDAYNQGADYGNSMQNSLDSSLKSLQTSLQNDYNQLIASAKNALQSQIDTLNSLAAQYRGQLSDLNNAKNALLSDYQSLQQRVAKLEAQMGWLPAIPKVNVSKI
jgi:hypothetical protein